MRQASFYKIQQNCLILIITVIIHIIIIHIFVTHTTTHRWGLMSITTAGNGQNVPHTGMGKVAFPQPNLHQLHHRDNVIPNQNTIINNQNVSTPQSSQVLGGATTLFGVFVLALPVPIILNTCDNTSTSISARSQQLS